MRINISSALTHLPAVNADEWVLAVRHIAQAAAEVVLVSADLHQSVGPMGVDLSIDPGVVHG